MTVIAWPTVVALLSLGGGLIIAHHTGGLMRLLLRDDPGGMLVRQMLPAAILIPLLLGYLETHGERAGIYDYATGRAILVIAMALIFSALLWQGGWRLSNAAAAQIKAEQEVRKSRDLLESFIENAPAGLAMFDRNMCYVRASKKWHLDTGLKQEAIQGRSHYEVFPTVPEQWKEAHRRGLAGEVAKGEGDWKALDGNTHTVRWTIHPWGDLGTDTHGIIIFSEDITERRRADDRLRWSEDQLRALTGRLQTASERERLRIARELHDQLGPALTGMKMDLDWIVRKHGMGREPWVAMVQDTMKLADSTIGLVRRLATDLRPDMLDALGLPAAIEWHTEEFQRRTGISCVVSMPEDPLSISGDQRIAAFRIYQEALTNIARHAHAKNVCVNLEREPNHAILTINDDGVGFPVDQLECTQSLGVVGMRERALLLGAQFCVQSVPGRGTTITLRIPLGNNSTTEQEDHEDIDR